MSRSEALAKYYTEVRKVSKKTNGGRFLNKEEERDLLVKAKAGDEKAKGILVSSNLKFAISIAREYRDQGIPLDDLISEANYGLIKAISEYNMREEVRFISYAVWWIRQSILSSFQDNLRTVRLPSSVQSNYSLVMKVKTRIEASKGMPASPDEIAAEIRHMTPNMVNEVIADSIRGVSFDDPIGEKDDSRIDLYVPPKEKSLSDDDREILKRRIGAAMTCLPKRDREIVKMFYGIDDEYEIPRSSEDIADITKMTTVNVNKIIRDSLARMKNFLKDKIKN